MKLLLVSEGPSELGRWDDDRGAALQTVCDRLLGRSVSWEPRHVRDRPRVHGKGDRNYKLAFYWIQYAEERGFDGLVLLIDRDGDASRSRAFDLAQQDSTHSIPRALGVAVEAFEAWILSDVRVLSQATGERLSEFPDPEGVSDPKTLLRSRVQSPSRPWSQIYRDVAGLADLQIWRRRCPRGFGEFSLRVTGCLVTTG